MAPNGLEVIVNKFDPKVHNIRLWLDAFDLYCDTKQLPDVCRIDLLEESFDSSLIKVIKKFRRDPNYTYQKTKNGLIKFIFDYLNRAINPVSNDHLRRMQNVFEDLNLDFSDIKFLLNAYCPIKEIYYNINGELGLDVVNFLSKFQSDDR